MLYGPKKVGVSIVPTNGVFILLNSIPDRTSLPVESGLRGVVCSAVVFCESREIRLLINISGEKDHEHR